MEKIYMSAGIITSIILCFIGIIKLPFKKLKSKKPKLYKGIFTSLSIVLPLGACLLNQAFILKETLFNFNFIYMLVLTYAGVFALYSSYEGLGFKALAKKIVAGIKTLLQNSGKNKEAKAIATVENTISELVYGGKLDINSITANVMNLVAKKKEEAEAKAKAEAEKTAKTQTNETNIAENK